MTTQTCTLPARALTAKASSLGAATRRLAGLVAEFLAWNNRLDARRTLNEMDEHLLHDIGLTRDDVRRLNAEPFWRV
jgi:uncharacterized protein YjiS (DUF1127 family)